MVKEGTKNNNKISCTWGGASLVVGVPLLEGLVDILLPVADGPAGVHARGGPVLNFGGPGLDHGKSDGADDCAGSEEHKSFQLSRVRTSVSDHMYGAKPTSTFTRISSQRVLTIVHV